MKCLDYLWIALSEELFSGVSVFALIFFGTNVFADIHVGHMTFTCAEVPAHRAAVTAVRSAVVMA